jgi:hypothetical protein
MSRKRSILHPLDPFRKAQMLEDAKMVTAACEEANREMLHNWLYEEKPWTIWERAVDALTRDPRLDLGDKATLEEIIAYKAKDWHDFGLVLHQFHFAARAEKLQVSDDEAQAVAVELFHLAARKATTQEFEDALLIIADRFDLWSFTYKVQKLVHQILTGKTPSGLSMSTSASSDMRLSPAEDPSTDDSLEWKKKVRQIIVNNPDETVAWYADRVGKSRQTLYKDREIRRMLKAKRKLKSERPRGYRNAAGNIEIDDRTAYHRDHRDEDE